MTKGIKRVVIATGGSGGHVFPALGLGSQLSKRYLNLDVYFIGGGLDKNRYFDRANPYSSVSCAPLFSLNPLKFIKGCFFLAKGVLQSYRLLKKMRPSVVVGFGSYTTFPVIAAAKLLNVPIILHEANSVPGKVQRFMSPFAEAVALHFPGSRSYFKGRCVETGMVLRPGYERQSLTKEESLAYYNLDPSFLTVLIFGGSQGAKNINACWLEALTHLKTLSKRLQVLHFTGEHFDVESIGSLYEKAGLKAVVKKFESRMDCAWRAADFFIGRAGAGAIAESMEYEVPGLLIPYPFAADQHQDKNADFLVEMGGAVKLSEKEMSAEKLAGIVLDLCGEKNQGFSLMQEQMRKYKEKKTRKDLSELVFEIASKSIS